MRSAEKMLCTDKLFNLRGGKYDNNIRVPQRRRGVGGGLCPPKAPHGRSHRPTVPSSSYCTHVNAVPDVEFRNYCSNFVLSYNKDFVVE